MGCGDEEDRRRPGHSDDRIPERFAVQKAALGLGNLFGQGPGGVLSGIGSALTGGGGTATGAAATTANTTALGALNTQNRLADQRP